MKSNFVVNIYDVSNEEFGHHVVDCAAFAHEASEHYSFARVLYDKYVATLFSWYLDSLIGLMKSKDKLQVLYIGVVFRNDVNNPSITYSVIFTLSDLAMNSFYCELKNFIDDVPAEANCNGKGFDLGVFSVKKQKSDFCYSEVH